MASLQVKGAEKLAKVARLLEEAGAEKKVLNGLRRDIRSEIRKIGVEQRVSLAAGLPKRGGADATIVSQSRQGTSIRMASSTVDASLVDSWTGHSMKAIDEGSLRHPLFGNRHHWYTTSIRRGLLSKPFERHRRSTQIAIIRSLDALAEKIAKETSA